MKKLFTIALLSVFAAAGLQAQNFLEDNTIRQYILSKSMKFQNNKLKNPTRASNSSRATVENLYLDYLTSDNFNAQVTQQTDGGFIWNVNTRYQNTDNFTLRFASVFFDSLLINLFNQAGTQVGTTYVPRANTTLTVDSVELLFNHRKTNATTDSLKVSVFNLSTVAFAGTGAAAVMNFTPLWDTIIEVTSQFPLLQGSQNFSLLTLKPGVTLPTGAAFGVHVDYTGDTSSQFNMFAGYKENCSDSFGANPSVVEDNSIYYINFTQQGQNISGINNLSFNRPTCGELWIQNFSIFAYVSTPVDFTSPITSEVKVGCPGTTSQLTTFPIGSDSLANPTFAWSVVPPTAGSFDDATAADPIFTFGAQSGRIELRVTDDAGNVSLNKDSFTVRSINISIAQNPIILNCGSTISIPTTVSGFTTGARNYSWSSGQNLTTGTLPGVNRPGIYTVTVTNSVGCTATTSTVVQYPNGLTNTPNFTLPSDNNRPFICKDREYTYTNTTARLTNWTSEWNFQGGGLSQLTNGTNTFTTLGNLSVKLTVDSANCKFETTKLVNVRDCSSINDASFDNNISLLPNPTNGNVTLEMATTADKVNVVVFNILGSNVKEFNETSNGTLSRNYNMSDLSNGTYIVRIQNGQKTATKRLVINK